MSDKIYIYNPSKELLEFIEKSRLRKKERKKWLRDNKHLFLNKE